MQRATNQDKKLYIAIDGPDAVGKSTILDKVVEKLAKNGYKCSSFSEPNLLRSDLLHNEHINDFQRAIAFIADHELTVASKLSEDFDIIIGDRCALSSIPVYQKLTDEEADIIQYLFYRAIQPNILFIISGPQRRDADNTIYENAERNESFYDFLVEKNVATRIVNNTIDQAADDIVRAIENLNIYQIR